MERNPSARDRWIERLTSMNFSSPATYPALSDANAVPGSLAESPGSCSAASTKNVLNTERLGSLDWCRDYRSGLRIPRRRCGLMQKRAACTILLHCGRTFRSTTARLPRSDSDCGFQDRLCSGYLARIAAEDDYISIRPQCLLARRNALPGNTQAAQAGAQWVRAVISLGIYPPLDQLRGQRTCHQDRSDSFDAEKCIPGKRVPQAVPKGNRFCTTLR